MNHLQSVRRGLIATAAVFASLLVCLAVSPEWLTGWGTFILVAMLVVVGSYFQFWPLAQAAVHSAPAEAMAINAESHS
jgi:hypothetical protein